MIQCLTDNVNRTVSDLRAVVNKCHIKMGAMGSVAFMYDNYAIVGFKGLSEEQAMEALIEADVDLQDIETDQGLTVIYGDPQDLYKIKDAISKVLPTVDFAVEEIAMVPKETIDITGEDLELFNKLLSLLDEVEDVQNVYHNVNL